MEEWLNHLEKDGTRRPSTAKRLLQHMRESTTSRVCVVLVTLLAAVDTLALGFDGESLSVRVPVRTFVAGCSCVTAQFILIHRKRVILNAFHRVRAAARQLPYLLDNPNSKGKITREVRYSRFLHWRVAPLYASIVDAGVLFTMLQDIGSPINSWIRQNAEGILWSQLSLHQLLRYSKWLFEVYSVSCCIACLFTLLLVEQALHSACAVLFSEVAYRFQRCRMARRQGNAIFNRIARLHISVLATCRDVNLAFGLLLPSYLLVSVLMSLLSTVSIILADGTPDFFALSCFSYLFIFFVPMCLAGQRLEDTGECVAQGTYR
ncbi:Odorant receptor 54, partial [Frankliniella occidentalis]